MGAGTLQPLAQAMFREAFPPEEQGLAMGVFGFVVLSGPAIGPALGGWITDTISWPWIFFVNIPIGIIGIAVAIRILKDPPYMKGGVHAPIDGIGIGLLAVGLAALQTVMEQGQEDDWFSSRFICWLLVISLSALVGFVIWELTNEHPAVDLRILKNATFASGTFIGGVLGMGLFASLFLLPQFMQLLLGFTATQSGLALMPRSLAMMAMMPIAGLAYNRAGAKPMIFLGLLLTVYSQWVMGHFTLSTSSADILVPQVIQGVGFAMVFVALSTVALSGVPREKMTSATGLNNLIRQLCGSIGTALVINILTNHINMARSGLVGYTGSADPSFTSRIGAYSGYFAAKGHGSGQRHYRAAIRNDRI
jgi:DHA2 family multidrug resistance protein